MDFHIQQENGYKYVERGNGPVLLLLHGLFGALSNFEAVIKDFSSNFRVIIPLIPLYEKNNVSTTVSGLTAYVEEFAAFKGIENCTLIGNSLGGHIALVYALQNKEKVRALVLTGSSGLFESGMGSGFPRRSSYEYVRERVAYTFYSPEMATKELVDEVFGIVNDNFKTLRVLKIARSAQRHNMRDDIVSIHVPTLLIWGLNDNITPPRVAHEFHKLIPNTQLNFIDKCGHVPMMEHPQKFNRILKGFLEKHVEIV
ncbi:MAG: alpha/beta hydrolase [Bacteroidetes bacterium]|nr:MAG: alpha/beta hydrolase [Bacteroidota bacterium]